MAGSSPPRRHPRRCENSIRRPGLGWERTYLARRDEEIVGVLGAWDTGAFHATRVVSYSAAATIARGVHAAARTVLREAAPLPEPGEAFRSLTITNLAVRGGDPRVLRALLSAVNNDHISQGFHLMHLGATAGEDSGAGTPRLAAAAVQLVALRAHPDGRSRATRRIALEPLPRPVHHLRACMGLHLSHEKILITQTDEGLDFLGWQCAPGRARFRSVIGREGSRDGGFKNTPRQGTNGPSAPWPGRGSVKVRAGDKRPVRLAGRGREEAAMRLSWRDGLATLLVAAAAVLSALWAADALMPGVSTRWMTVIAFALGVAACTANQRELGEVYGATREGPRPSGLYIALATALGVVTLVAGILAFVLASEAMLATLVAAMVALWLIATARHALTGRYPQLRAHPAAH